MGTLGRSHGDFDTDARFAEAFASYLLGPIGSELQTSYAQETAITTARTFWGDEMEIILPELVACELHRFGLIEPGLTCFFLDTVRPGSVVYDVGAHLGYYTLLGAHLGATVHAFEPSGDTFARLANNVGGRATLVRRVVWSEPRTLQLNDFGAEHSAVNSLFAPKDESLGEPVDVESVEAVNLDDYSAATGTRPALIKIDAEGAEARVLQGARSLLERTRPIVTIEVGDAEGSPRSRAAVDLALDLGYEVFEVSPQGVEPHHPQDIYEYGNLALIPRG